MRATLALMPLIAWAAACSHDWDAFDPRLAGGSGGSSSVTVGGSGSGASGTGGATTSGTGGGATTSGTGGGATTSGTGGGTSEQVTYGAAIAACIDTTTPSTAACAAQNGGNRMTVDLVESTTMTPRHSYVRFDLDGTLSGKIVDAVSLRLVVAVAAGAESNQTGEIWKVSPFDVAALDTAAPGQLGGSAISPNQGMVAQGQVVTFPLPVGIVAANQSTYLGVLPLTTEGVDYWNDIGADPPTLIVTYH